jgi:hypothetical protein
MRPAPTGARYRLALETDEPSALITDVLVPFRQQPEHLAVTNRLHLAKITVA